MMQFFSRARRGFVFQRDGLKAFSEEKRTTNEARVKKGSFAKNARLFATTTTNNNPSATPARARARRPQHQQP